MLRLFEARDKEVARDQIRQTNYRDSSHNEFLKNQKKKEKFNEDILRGERDRRELKTAAQSLQNKNCKATVTQCEEALGWNLGERKSNAIREDKLRQLLWQNAPELKELRKKILIADVSRDQAMQIAEKQALMQLKREEGNFSAEKARLEKAKLEEEEKRKELEERLAKKQYHRDLDQLRGYKLQRDAPDEDELELERKAIDVIKKQIEEENRDEMRKKIEKQMEYHRQAQELQRVRQDLRLQEKLKDQLMDMKDDEFRKAQDLRAKEQEEKKQLTLEYKLLLQDELLSYLERIYSEKLRKESMRTELAIEEKDASEKEKEWEVEKRKMKIRDELQRLYEMQVYVKRQKEELQRKEEELYRQNLMEKLYEEDKLEYMSQQKQRVKKLEHNRIAQLMLEESRKKKAMERAREMADHQYQMELESERKKMVKEEKIRFLQECAGELLGYLPKGIFSDDETIQHLGDEFKKFYFREKM